VRAARFHIVRRLRALGQTSLMGPVLTLVSGTIAAQAFTYLARPVLTRLFTPDAFGVFGFFLAVVAVFSTAGTGKYEDSVPLPRDAKDAAGVAVLAVAFSFLLSIATLVMIPYRAQLAGAFGRPEVAPILILVPLAILVVAWSRTAELWLTRTHAFAPIASARALQAGAAVPAQVGAGILGAAGLGLAGGYLAGRFIGLVTMITAVLRTPRTWQLKSVIAWSDLRRLARRYRRFPAFSMPSAFLNTLSSQLPAFLLLALFAPAFAGWYAIAYASLAVPMQLVGSSVAQVFFAHAASAHRDRTLAPLTERVYARLSAVGLYPMAAIALAAPPAFAIIFGAEWREAGVYAQFLAPWMFFVFVSAPLSNLFDVLERQHQELLFNVAMTLSRALALIAGAVVGDARIAVALFALVSAAFWLGHTIWMLRWAGASLRRSSGRTLRHASLAIPALTPLFIGRLMGLGDLAMVGLLVFSGLIALVLFWRFEPLLPGPSHG